MLPAARGALQLGADLLIWECLVLVCPELVETKNYSQRNQDYSFCESTKLSGQWKGSLLECWCFMELGVAGREGCVLGWWQTGSCTKP